MMATERSLQLSGEPTLEDLLSEPAVLALLKRDGIDPVRYRQDLKDLAAKLRQSATKQSQPDCA